MTAIATLDTALPAFALASKRTPFVTTDGVNSFAALLDHAAPETQSLPISGSGAALPLKPDLVTPSNTNAANFSAALSDRTKPAQVNSEIAIEDVPNPPAPAPSAAAIGASDILPTQPQSDAGRQARIQPRLFTFVELGMFGRHSAQFATAAEPDISESKQFVASTKQAPALQSDPANTGTTSQPAQMRNPPEMRNPVQQFTQSAPLPQNSQQENSPVLQSAMNPPTSMPQGMQLPSSLTVEDEIASSDLPASGGSPANEIVYQPANPEPPSTPHFAPPSENEPVPPAEEGGAPQMPPPLPESRSQNSLNLVVSGSANALTIVARSSDTGTEPARLRRLIVSTAAEFGMDVAEFRINGFSVEPSLSSGGNHGRRAR